MSVFDDVADDPKPGDTIILPGGQITYEVKFLGSAADDIDLSCERAQTLREPPFVKIARVGMDWQAWEDLVRFACTVKRAL